MIRMSKPQTTKLKSVSGWLLNWNDWALMSATVDGWEPYLTWQLNLVDWGEHVPPYPEDVEHY